MELERKLPTAVENFQNMVQALRKEWKAESQGYGRIVRKSLQIAHQVLSAPEEENPELIKAFERLRLRDVDAAHAAYQTLLRTRVLFPEELRARLELPAKGPVVRRTQRPR